MLQSSRTLSQRFHRLVSVFLLRFGVSYCVFYWAFVGLPQADSKFLFIIDFLPTLLPPHQVSLLILLICSFFVRSLAFFLNLYFNSF